MPAYNGCLRKPYRQPCSRGAPFALAAALAVLLLGLGGCEDLNWPFHRARARASDAAPADAGSGGASAECTDLLAQIRASQEMRREAPTTSTNPDIVDATQGKADKRIEDLQQRYEELDCPAADAAATNRPGRQPPLQPAPGGGSR